jgi:hypothetical protein
VLYGSENWAITARDARRITVSEITCMRKRAGYPCTDYKSNTEMAKELI